MVFFFFLIYLKQLTSECVRGRDLFLIIQIIPGRRDQNLSPIFNMMGQNVIPMCKSINLGHCHELIFQRNLKALIDGYWIIHHTIRLLAESFFDKEEGTNRGGGGGEKVDKNKKLPQLILSYDKEQHKDNKALYTPLWRL